MRNLFKSKKMHSFLLTMIMVISLFLFSASSCDDKEGERKILKIIYKPYSTSRPSLVDKTYGEIIEEGLLDMSSDVLSYLVGFYGIGEVDVKKDAESTQKISPDNSGVNYQSLLAISGSLSNTDKEKYSLEFSKLTNVYFSSTNKILALTNDSNLNVNNVVTYDTENSKYVAKVNLKKVSGTGGSFSSDSDLTNNCAYKYENGEKITYIFIGGYIGSSSSVNSFSSALNASKYVADFFKTNFNNIQKALPALTESSFKENLTNLPFASWAYSLTETEAKSCSSAQDYLEKYVQKFNLNFAVEIANTILTRYDDWELNEELSSLYSSASTVSASKSSKENFIKECCKYIDHLGFLDEEKVLLTSFIKETFIGSTITNSNPKYEENCATIFENVSNVHVMNPILEYKTFVGSSVDEVEIDGYLQSIVIMTEKEFTFDTFSFEVINKIDEEETVFYKNSIRYCNDGKVEEYPIKDIDYSEITYIDCPQTEDKEGSKNIVLKISSCADNLPFDLLGAQNTIKKDISDYFSHTKNSSNSKVKESSAWCFSDASASYIEIVFAVDNIFNQNEVNLYSIFL